MALTTTGSPFSLNIPSASSDLADLFGSYLVPNMTAVNTYAAHKATAQTFSALQTFSAGLNVTAGNVGIGTSSPGYNLEVSGEGRFSSNIRVAGVTVDMDAVSNANVVLGNVGDGSGWSAQGIGMTSGSVGHVATIGSANGTVYFGMQNGTAVDSLATYMQHVGSTRYTSFNAGNVGIGTSTPGYSLDVVAGANLAARFRGAAGNHTVVTLDSASDSYAPYLLFQRNGADKWLLQAWTDNNFYVLDDDLNNGVYIAQDTTSWTANSDARLKDVIGPIENATAKVNALSGVRYTWKRDADKSLAKVRVGLIAQDVFDVLPESVEAENPDIITDEETGKVSGGLGVRYTELVPLLVNAIKELAQRVEALEA